MCIVYVLHHVHVTSCSRWPAHMFNLLYVLRAQIHVVLVHESAMWPHILLPATCVDPLNYPRSLKSLTCSWHVFTIDSGLE